MYYDELEKELKVLEKAHVEVEWYLDNMAKKPNVSTIAKKIIDYFDESFLDWIIENRLIKYKVKLNEELSSETLSPEDIKTRLLNKEFDKTLDQAELIGGLVQKIDYVETKKFLRETNLFKTISEIFEDKQNKQKK